MGYWLDDPNGGAPSYVEGNDPSMGDQETGPGKHTSKKRLLWEQGRNFIVPATLGIADAYLGGYGAAQAAGLTGGGTGAATGAGTAATAAGTAAAPSLAVPVGSTLLPGTLATTSATTLGAAPVVAAAAPTIAAAAPAAATGAHMTPEMAMMLMQGGGQGISSIANSRAQKKALEQQIQLAREKMAADKALADQDTAAKEGTQDPFRQQLDQAHALATLDQMGNASYEPRKIGPPPSRYAKYVTEMSGGFSWSPTPQLQGDARNLQQNVRAGNVAPTMTNPANFGKTAAVDLTSVDRGTNPASPGASAQGPNVLPSSIPPPVPADLLPPITGAPSRLNGYKAITERRQRISQWEQANPGWTIDPTTGQAVRRSTA